jgi:hypothetical protein
MAPQTPSWLRRHAVTVIMLFFGTLMTLLVAEQGRIIESQRRLIRQLFRDTLELNEVKMRESQAQRR